MKKFDDIDTQIALLNRKFVCPMFLKSKVYSLKVEAKFENFEAKYIQNEMSDRDSCWLKSGVYIFIDADGEPLYCGEASRQLWGRVYDYFAKGLSTPFSEMHARSPFKEVPAAVILYFVNSGDNLDDGMGYALEQRLLRTCSFKYNKKGAW